MSKTVQSNGVWKRGPRNNGMLGDGRKPKKPIKFKLVNYRLPDWLVEDLRVISNETKKTQREHVETALLRYLRKRKRELKQDGL